jgi:UDP-2,4-diacetamido-2,4,6-trideoxy-beta-L-altropyranose hydrolase
VPVYVDDTMRLEYPRGIVVNGTIDAEKMSYTPREGMKYLLGAKYIPLRKAFLEIQEKTIAESVKKIMITFGGDDTRCMTRNIVDIMRFSFPHIELTVVVGKGFKDQFTSQIIKDVKTKYVFNPDDSAMKELMFDTDIAISAGGQTLYELARMGVPSVVIAVADNQRCNIQGWQGAGFIKYAGVWKNPDLEKDLVAIIGTLLDQNIRNSMSVSGRKMVDGRGALRLVNEVLSEAVGCF